MLRGNTGNEEGEVMEVMDIVHGIIAVELSILGLLGAATLVVKFIYRNHDFEPYLREESKGGTQ